MRFLIFLSCLFSIHYCYSQTFTTVGDSIPDNGTAVEFPLEVSGISAPMDTAFGLATLCFSMKHRNVSDIRMFLVSPSGKVVYMFGGIGWDGNDFINTCISNRSYPLIFNASAPFTGTFCPMQSLGQHNNGQTPNGIWKLRITDLSVGYKGFLQNWSLTFSNAPTRIFPFVSTNLPIVLVDTRSEIIPNEPKIAARIKVMNQPNGARNFLTDTALFNWFRCGIEERGSSSATFPKKSYGFEFQDETGDDLSVSVLGMPEQSDWVLSANYSDKSLMRNVFAYDLSRRLGQYAPRTRYVELFLNDEYQGVYVLAEKIKRDASRVDISKLKSTDTSAIDRSGGYILKIDKPTGNDTEGFTSSFPPVTSGNGQTIRILYDYPKSEDLVPVQKQYIKAYIDSFETALHSPYFDEPHGYRRFAQVSTFIDYFIVNEWSKNVDGYRFSTFITKPKVTSSNGGRLIMGPVWDYDLGWRNADYCEVQNIPGWSYRLEDVCPSGLTPTWWHTFRTDPIFNNELKCKWLLAVNEIMPSIKRTAWVDSVRTLLGEAQQRNFTYWPILGQYVWPNPLPLATNYLGETVGFQNWLSQRAAWITANLGGTCITENQGEVELPPLTIYPNPAKEEIILSGLSGQQSKVSVFNGMGQVFTAALRENCLEIKHLTSGLYWILIPGRNPVKFVKE